MKASSLFATTVQGDRIDWQTVKDRIDLGLVTTALLGPSPGRRGERGLWWVCPFHDDKNPSLRVNPAKGTWRCYGCSEHGDAAALVMKLNHWSFPEAIAYLAGKPAPSGKPIRPRPPAASPVKTSARPPDTPSGLPLADALALVLDAETRLWTPEGSDALAYLKGRGLTPETIRQARLGITSRDGVEIPKKDGGTWKASGVVIPWFDGDRLALVKVRRLGDVKGAKYVEAFRDRPTLFPAPSVVRPGKPLIVAEGEFDSLLLGQELGELAAVVTLGSASSKPEAPILMRLLAAAPWYVALDADPAGDLAASGWPPRAIRVRPPSGKDWTEAQQAGINLRRWWTDRLGGNVAPAMSTWDELSARRWGPAISDPTPGIVIDRPARGESCP